MAAPKPSRERVGLPPGEVEVTAEGSGLCDEPPGKDLLEERGGRLVIGGAGLAVSDELVRTLRDSGQR